MNSRRKFKRDYIILEAKDLNFRFKEKTVPKAFAKVEVSDEKAIVALYVENLKYVESGYRVVTIQNNYDVEELGEINVSEQGKGEFILNLEDNMLEVRAIALVHQNNIPLIGFKGMKIDNYEELILEDEDEDEDDRYEDDEYEEIVEYEYIEIEDEDDRYEKNEYENIHKAKSMYNNYQEDYRELNPKDDKEYYIDANENKRCNGKEHVGRNYFEEENETRNRAFLMPRQIKKGLKRFKETKPFVTEQIESTRWWKIDINPMTLCGYNMPYLGYINLLNYTMYSDTSMNSYKYRHYLFGVQYDEYNNRKYYIYAIPGNKDEQPDKGNTGFVEFIPCDDKNDDIGYWICMIDPRSRTIKK